MKNIILLFFIFLSPILTISLNAQQTSYKFSFGTNEIRGYIKADPSVIYSSSQGYGFDFGTQPVAVDREGKRSVTSGFCTSDKPFYFSVKLPEGNYNIKIIIGDLKEEAVTNVRFESRRLYFENIRTAPGKYQTLETTVNIRTPLIAGTNDSVKLKPRELYKLDWDDKLTFEFSGSRPCICAIEISKNEDAVTVYLAGNSTVVDQDDDPWASWGQMIPRFFKPGVAFSNQAESGLSLGSFISSNRLKKVLSTIKPGDYLFIEFGHNDQKEKGPNDGAYLSYTERLWLFVDAIKKKGAVPVVVSPANRRSFDETGRITNSLGDYPDAARKVAKDLNVAFIDLNAMTRIFYESLGVEKSKNAFVIYPANTFSGQTEALNDNTHFNSYGAYQLAKCIIEGIRNNVPELSKHLLREVQVYDPSKPDPFENFSLPPSPRSPVIVPKNN
jgi:lysophospholipase L1-like esterase